jgi:hypothetical protein
MSLRFVVFLTVLSIVCPAFSEEFLQTEDIRIVMERVFSQHVEQKQMTKGIMRDAIRQYLYKFDPNKIYLLEREVTPYFSMSEVELANILAQVKNGDYSLFINLNNLIQRAIERNRGVREELEKDKALLFKKGKATSSWKQYAHNVDDLKERVAQDIRAFIQEEKRLSSEQAVMRTPSKVLEKYNRYLMTNEDQYLFVDRAGNPLNSKEKENLSLPSAYLAVTITPLLMKSPATLTASVK